GGSTADMRRRLEGVRRAVIAAAVAVLGDVAVADRGTTQRRALGVVRTDAARSGAGLRQVADTRGGPTDRSGGQEAVARTRIARPVARLGDVAGAARRATDGPRRLLQIRRARRGEAGTILDGVARAIGRSG